MNQKTTLLVLTFALAITGALAVAPILSEMAYAASTTSPLAGRARDQAGVETNHPSGPNGYYTTNGHHHCFGEPGC